MASGNFHKGRWSLVVICLTGWILAAPTTRSQSADQSAIITWAILREWLILSFLSSFAWNQSNQDVFDYSVADVGGGAALIIRF